MHFFKTRRGFERIWKNEKFFFASRLRRNLEKRNRKKIPTYWQEKIEENRFLTLRACRFIAGPLRKLLL